MSGYAAATATALYTVQTILSSLQGALAPPAFSCPTSASIDTIQSIGTYDYVIIGAGEAGSILAYRLAETNASVLVLEEGGCPPLESVLAGYFTTLPNSTYDRGMEFVDDGYTRQNQKPYKGATAGKMLGGSGSLNHLIYVPPFEDDYTYWATAANDSSWGFPDFADYFAKSVTVTDELVLAQNTTLYGTSGPTILTRETSSDVNFLLNAHDELMFPVVNDATGGVSVCQPLLFIGDGLRQCGHMAYLSKLVNQTSVRFLTGAIATKVLFNGTTANGVQFTYSDTTYNVTAGKVILSAGALKSPQLLLVSGVGNATTLEDLGIDSVVDNSEVGQNLQDHIAAVTAIALDENTATAAAADPRKFPVPMVTTYDNLNKRATQPARQDIILYFTSNSSGLLQLCVGGFKYTDEVCDNIYEGNINRNVILNVHNLLHTSSTGSVTINSKDATDNPVINLGLLSNSADLDYFGELMVQYFESLLNTASMQNLNATFIDHGFCSNYTQFSLDYWKCYIVEMSSTMWHYSGTCALGKVVDASLNVIGTKNLKVVDASVIPYQPSGNIGSCVRALAEKAADIIKTEDGLS